MMSKITKVALEGATGKLVPTILNQLVDAGFKVTVLTGKDSTHTFPPAVTLCPVDYDSLDSLSNALEGQDAFVSTLEIIGLPTQLLCVLAAAKAHIKRFIPGEFGSNTLNENVRILPTSFHRVEVQDALKKEAASGGMTYSIICTGPFLDHEIKNGSIMDLRDKTIDLFDGGNRVFSTTSLPTVGKAIIGVLTHLEETKNRAVYVQDTATTLQKLAAMGEKATGADGWKKNVVSVTEMFKQAWVDMIKKPPGRFVREFEQAASFGEGYGSHFEKNDNELLGLGQMSDAEVQNLVDSLASKVGANRVSA